MKKIFIGSVMVLLSVMAGAQSKTCTEGCASTTVLLFDFDVRVAKENTNPAFLQHLYFIAPWLRKQVAAKVDCLEYLDINAVNKMEDIFSGGSETPRMYVDEPVPYQLGEYLLTGTVTGEGTVFMVTANIETSVSRKKIKTVHVPCVFSEGDTYASVAQKIQAALGSLPDLVRDYETKERETNLRVAFGQPITKAEGRKELLIIKPRKTKLAMGEEMEVEITMTDCDGYPLKNRLISFTGEMYDSIRYKGTHGGTVTPSKITTDASGKAKVKFKAGKEYAYAVIVGHYTFEQPCGRKKVITGSAAIDMQLKPYKVMVKYIKRLRADTDYSNATSEYTEKSEGLQNYVAQYKAEFYYAPRQPLEELSIASNDDSDIAKIFVAAEEGSSSDVSFLHYLRRATDGTLISDYQNTVNMQGTMVEDEKAAVIVDTSGIRNFGLILNLSIAGTHNGESRGPDVMNVVNKAVSSFDKGVVYDFHPMNYPGFPYKRNCVFIYANNEQKSDHGVLTKYSEFLQVMLLIEK